MIQNVRRGSVRSVDRAYSDDGRSKKVVSEAPNLGNFWSHGSFCCPKVESNLVSVRHFEGWLYASPIKSWSDSASPFLSVSYPSSSPHLLTVKGKAAIREHDDLDDRHKADRSTEATTRSPRTNAHRLVHSRLSPTSLLEEQTKR